MNAYSNHIFRHLINGRLESSEQWFDVLNPASETVVAKAPDATRQQLDAAVAAARQAQPAWAATSLDERRQVLKSLADALLQHAEDLAALITLEQGKPLKAARAEVTRAAEQVVKVAALPLENDLIEDTDKRRVEVTYAPLGVVGAITPWNVPVMLAMPKITHALYTGNTIVLKPSEYTPLNTLLFGEWFKDLVPPGVINILGGGRDLGRWISEHPGIDKISFTGSVATGKKVMASAAGSLKRVTLELGGNDAAIVLDDADPAEIAPAIFNAAFLNSGQICMAIKRLYVPDALYDDMCNALAEIARKTRVGDGMDPDTELGPVQNAAQAEIVAGILADAKQHNGRFLTGGERLPRPGYFFEPAIVADLAEGTRVVDEEPFGPVLPVIRYSRLDDAIRRANATQLGLGASVWSADVERANAVARQLDAGNVWVNRHVGVEAAVPFGGSKQSGLGCEYGIAGLRQYQQGRSLYLQK